MSQPTLQWGSRLSSPESINGSLELHDSFPNHQQVSNLFIMGDNLLALHALSKTHAKTIKFAYLDPPYNTGNRVDFYSDKYSHTDWLQFIQDRIYALIPLMKDDGIVAVQIGSEEMAYLKVLMDELIGREKCIGQIAVRMSHSAGLKRRAKTRRLIKNTEYILIYYVDKQPILEPLYEECIDYPVNYYQYIVKKPDADVNGVYKPLLEVMKDHFKDILIENNRQLHQLYASNVEFRNFVTQHRHAIARKDSNLPIRFQNLNHLEPNEFTVRIQNGRRYLVGQSVRGNQWQLYTLGDKFNPVLSHRDKKPTDLLSNLIGDWWDNFWRDMSRVDTEGGVKMKISKKPERLIAWLLRLCTKPGDIVIDPFLGTGTTAAVCHDMSRKWVGIELGAHAETHALKRLRGMGVTDFNIYSVKND